MRLAVEIALKLQKPAMYAGSFVAVAVHEATSSHNVFCSVGVRAPSALDSSTRDCGIEALPLDGASFELQAHTKSIDTNPLQWRVRSRMRAVMTTAL
jgi:hypothetical protein